MTMKMNNKDEENDMFGAKPTEKDIAVMCAEMEELKILTSSKGNLIGYGSKCEDVQYALSDRFLARLAIDITEHYKPNEKNAMEVIITSMMKTMKKMFTKDQIYDYYKIIEATMYAKNMTVDEYVHEAYEFGQNNWDKFQ